MLNIPLALNVWQSMDVTLDWISLVITVMALVTFIAILVLGGRLARLVRIGLAIHERLKELVELGQTKEENAQRPPPNAEQKMEEEKPPTLLAKTPRHSEAATAPEVYRID